MRAIDADNLNWGRCPANATQTKAWLDEAPTITYEDLVPHGRWKRRGRNLGECSECGEVVAVRHRYCPNCGAKMDLED